MTTNDGDLLGHLPAPPRHPDRFGIGVVGAGFIVRDCHLVAYQNAGFRVSGIFSRTIEKSPRGRDRARNRPGL